MLGIDLATKRRNRANGVVTAADRHGFTLDVRQSFGNCPQYIHAREVETAATRTDPTETLTQLDNEARGQIEASDTFFVASAARTGEANGGVDMSHRGGPLGFVRVRASPAAQRLWRVRVEQAFRRRGALALRWRLHLHG